MNKALRIDQQSGLAQIAIDAAPRNLLDLKTRLTIWEALDDAEADQNIAAIVIFGRGAVFSQGADPHEMEHGQEEPTLAALCDRIERCNKPVIASMHGAAIGAGLELALAAHYRLALVGTRLQLPEILQAALPIADGALRLVRVVGVELALRMLLRATPVSATIAERSGLVDARSQASDPLEAALEFYHDALAPRPTRKRRDHLQDAGLFLVALREARERLSQDLFSPRIRAEVVTTLENALLLPFEVAQNVTRGVALAALASEDARGHRHAARVKSAAMRHSTPVAPPKTVGILGGGALGAQLASAAVKAGLSTILIDESSRHLAAGTQRIAGLQPSEIVAKAVLSKLVMTERLEDLSRADIVVDTLPDASMFRVNALERLDGLLAQDAVFLTSHALGPDEGIGREAQSLALHVASPVLRLGMAELLPTPVTKRLAQARAKAFLRRLSIVPMDVPPGEASLIDVLQGTIRHVADLAVLHGAKPAQVDASMRLLGFEIGPYQLADLIGLDTPVMRSAAQMRPQFAARLVASGQSGRHAGRGIYLHDGMGPKDRAPTNPDAMALITKERLERGLAQRRFRDADIQNRMAAALANCAADLLQAGRVQSPDEIDAACVYGLGYPARRGGPLWNADRIGAYELARMIETYRHEDPLFWQHAPLLQKLARERGKFSNIGAI